MEQKKHLNSQVFTKGKWLSFTPKISQKSRFELKTDQNFTPSLVKHGNPATPIASINISAESFAPYTSGEYFDFIIKRPKQNQHMLPAALHPLFKVAATNAYTEYNSSPFAWEKLCLGMFRMVRMKAGEPLHANQGHIHYFPTAAAKNGFSDHIRDMTQEDHDLICSASPYMVPSEYIWSNILGTYLQTKASTEDLQYKDRGDTLVLTSYCGLPFEQAANGQISHMLCTNHHAGTVPAEMDGCIRIVFLMAYLHTNESFTTWKRQTPDSDILTPQQAAGNIVQSAHTI